MRCIAFFLSLSFTRAAAFIDDPVFFELVLDDGILRNTPDNVVFPSLATFLARVTAVLQFLLL